MPSPGPRIRASDADRDRAAVLLREHHVHGRLSGAEFEERLAAALRARTLDELDDLLADLPGIDLYELPHESIGRPPSIAGYELSRAPIDAPPGIARCELPHESIGRPHGVDRSESRDISAGRRPVGGRHELPGESIGRPSGAVPSDQPDAAVLRRSPGSGHDELPHGRVPRRLGRGCRYGSHRRPLSRRLSFRPTGLSLRVAFQPDRDGSHPGGPWSSRRDGCRVGGCTGRSTNHQQ